jgi:threonine/homoserine/homoserine lactone efflux protein
VDILTGFLVGIGVGIFSTWFPGMLNMQAVATAVRAGRPRAYRFSIGMACVFPIQAGIAIFFANYLTDHPWIMEGLRQWSVPLLIGIGVFFVAKGVSARAERKAEVVKPYKGGPFKRGFGMAFLNILNIPLFFAIGGWLLAHGYLPDTPLPKLIYIFGVGFGALSVFFTYTRLSEWFTRRAAMLTRNINFVIGGLLFTVAVVQAVRMWEG